MSHSPQVGDRAPDFALEGTEGQFRLADHHGERVVLLFYPGDETPVCTKQFCSYRDHGDDLEALDATVVGISAQSIESHQAFTRNHGLNVPLLADPDKEVARAYGVTAPVLGTRRAVFVIDENGVVRYRKVHALGLDFHSVEQLREALDQVGAPSRV